MRTMRVFSMTWLLVLALPVAAHAQSTAGTVTTQTGSIVTMDSGALLHARIAALKIQLKNRLPDSGATLLVPGTKLSAWQSDTARYTEKSTDYRATCSEVIRRANRDNIMKLATTCFRGDLLLHSTFLRKQLSYIEAIPLLDDAVRASGVMTIKNLIDAEMTVVSAIDAGLYEQMAGLEDAKQKLRTQYRAPYWLALSNIRADRQLTFIGLMLKKIESIQGDTTNSTLLQKNISDAVSCLAKGSDTLHEVLSSAEADTSQKALLEANKTISDCKISIRSMMRLRNLEQEKNKDNSEPQPDAKN
jgi:hypothetical protein